MRESAGPRPTLPLRVVAVILVALLAAAVLLALLVATDTALSIVERLRAAPMWLVAGIAALFAGLLGFSGWVGWRLLRPRAPVRPAPSSVGAPPTRAALEDRAEALARRGAATGVAEELAQLDARRALGTAHVALCGEIGAGKSSLLRALAGRDDVAVGVRGGTTTVAQAIAASLPSGREAVFVDLPGLFEAGDTAHGASAREEALRAHAVVFVVDGDLTRDEAAALDRLLALGKPTVLALNKTDRYTDAEREALLHALRERWGARAAVVPIRAGGTREVERELPDGRRELVLRPQAPELARLLAALDALLAPGAAALEPGRERAVLAALDERLAAAETALRARDAEAVVARYTRRAVVGALAAVAPGTDLVIQGALATGMLRELAQLHGVGLRELDLDGFVTRAAGTVRTATSLTLAIAGNALKAFPGLGTVAGGLLHAVAYGLVFDALGRAVAATLGARSALDPEVALADAEQRLREPAGDRVRALAQLAIEEWRRRP